MTITNDRDHAAWRQLVAAVACSSAMFATSAIAQETEDEAEEAVDEVIVTGRSTVFGNNLVTEEMRLQQSPITSVNAVIDNLPGVSVQEGDTYGFDDWSTTVSVRGFQVSLDEQQIGTTIDGIPNGNSNYGGGAKANRYIDAANLAGVEVSQGTADIASRSLEALGGTLNFLTDNPTIDSRVRAQVAGGEFDAQRYYLRYDTGMLGNTRAYISVSHQNASDWVNGIAENTRDHFAAKVISSVGEVDITAYVSYDDTQEDNYQRLFTEAEFVSNPEWDRLTDDWSGIPYVDQVFRQGWSTLRENLLTYVKAETLLGDSFRLSGGVYYHDNEGRGDWIPPYLLDLTDDGAGPQSEVLGGTTVNGGAPLGRIYFVDGAGNALSPTPGCVSSITFPYGGAGPESDPACHDANALAVQSYRHTHYAKERTGGMLDFSWDMDIGTSANTLRGGVWLEDQTRDEFRDWHKITDTRVGIPFDNQPYWIQYDRSYPQDTFKWYVEDSINMGDISLTLGAKQFLVDVERRDLFGESADAAIDSDSDVLFSGGFLWTTPVEGLEVFAGYAENFKAVSDLILERPDSDLDTIEPETAENIEVGVRYVSERGSITATYYDIDFNNRIIFLSPETESGPDYVIGTNGTYFNAGGIESSGVEIAATLNITDEISVYAAYTYNDSTYVGTGDPAVDAAVGITPGNTVVGIADNQFVTSLDWVGDKLRAGITAKYTGDRFIRFDNTWAAEAYTVADAYLGFNAAGLGDGFEALDINVVINNLFDEDYLGGIAGQGAWIGAPRTFGVSATLDF